MAKHPRLTLRLLVDTAAHAASIHEATVQQVLARPRFADRFESSAVSADGEGRGWVVEVDVRMLTRSDRDAVREWVRQQVEEHPQVRSWVLGAVVTSHLCTHDDEEPRPCTESEFKVHVQRGLPIL